MLLQDGEYMVLEQDAQQAKWNFDGAEAEAIFALKASFINFMRVWRLDDAYWILRTIRMELDAKLSRGRNKAIEKMQEEMEERKEEDEKKKKLTEKEEVDAMLSKVTNERNTFNEDPTAQENKIIFFQVLEDFYMHLCYLMKKHGLYFREGEDNTLAVLKR
jgi:hypothetical protein